MSNIIYFPSVEDYEPERWEIHEKHMSFRITKHKDSEYKTEYRLPFQPEWTYLYLPKRIDGEWDADAFSDFNKVLRILHEKYAELCEREKALGRIQ